MTNMTQKRIAKKWDISEEMIQGINTGRYIKYNRPYPIRKRNYNMTNTKKYASIVERIFQFGPIDVLNAI